MEWVDTGAAGFPVLHALFPGRLEELLALVDVVKPVPEWKELYYPLTKTEREEIEEMIKDILHA